MRSVLQTYKIFLLTLAFADVALAQSSEVMFSEPVVENYTITAPGLLNYGDVPLRFFFLRDAQVWNGETVVDLAKLKWPSWDTNQVPYSIVPVTGQKLYITLYNSKREEIETLQLKKNFSIEQYNSDKEQKAAFYQFRGLLEKERIAYRGRVLPYKSPKTILSCEAGGDPLSAVERKKIDSCLQSFRSYVENSSELNRQLFVRVTWPKVSDRSLRMNFQTTDRDLGRNIRQAGHIYLSDKNKKRFSAELGLTENENLNVENLNLKELPVFEKVASAPQEKEAQQVIHEISLSENSGLQFFVHSNDRISARTFEKIRVGQSQINLQIVASAGTGTPLLEKNQNFEKRTGLAGALRKWQILGFGGWNQLVSSRGESNQLTGLPGISAKYNLGIYELYPHISYENTILKAQSQLSVSELKVGLEQRQPWLENLSLSVGYHHYSLSGKNPGADRLGGIEAGSLGASLFQRYEEYLIRQKAAVMIGNTYSYGVQVEFGKLLELSGSDTLFVGPFLSYNVYRGNVVNKLGTREVFSENRTQFGIMIGIIGADSY